MQFHLNGFRTGDPEIFNTSATPAEVAPAIEPLPGEVDVLIVGCGPAGLTLAAQLAAFPEIKTCIVDQKVGRLLRGQADGIACRTVEMFHAFGFSERVLKEGYWVNETTFWKPDDSDAAKIVRSGRIMDTEEGLSEFPHVILNQARVHDFFLDGMRKAPAALEPHYGRRLVGLELETPALHNRPTTATVRFEQADEGHTGDIETVKARYVVGCDGARSAVRQSIGRALHGDSANHAWGVMDVLAVTDFPDIRLKSLIQSANQGSIVIIPREGGYLVRLYIELDKLAEGERVSHLAITADQLVAAARRILQPYTFDVKEVAWWSVYEIGQRLCDKFDDVPDDQVAGRLPQVFIAGDACHTHSPKAGQGMNVSMQDSLNLGWKLASVLRRQSDPRILHTYSAERQAIARELIEFDREWAAMLSTPSTDAAFDPAATQQYFVTHGRYTAGTATRYSPSVITAEPTYQKLASGFEVGMRFHSAPVIRFADAKPVQLGHTIKADGRWRLFAFADPADPASPASAMRALCAYLAESKDSPLRRYTRQGDDVDSVIDVRAVFQQSHRLLAAESLPPLLLPRKGRYGLIDYEKVFCPEPNENIFDQRGIDRERGCLVVVRPDQYVAHVLPLEATQQLWEFFAGFMVGSG